MILTATAATGSSFAGWSGACTGTATNSNLLITCTVNIDSAKIVTATFNLKSYSLTVAKNVTGSSTITSSPTGIS